MEEWREVPGYKDLYEVSSLGRVKSIPRKICNHQGCYISKEKILKPILSRKYYLVILSNSYLNIKQTKAVHQLVAMAFLNHIPCGYKLVVDHINDNPQDNRVENLQLITQRENAYKTQGKGSSKYKGVSWDKDRNKWVARININGKNIYLGGFNNEEEAHQAYQNKLKTI